MTLLSPANTHAPSLANSTELLHFLETDKHVHSYATEALAILAQSVRTTFSQLVRLLEQELALVCLDTLSKAQFSHLLSPSFFFQQLLLRQHSIRSRVVRITGDRDNLSL